MLDELKDKAEDLVNNEKVQETVEKVKEFASTEKGKEVVEEVKEKVTDKVSDILGKK